MLNHSESCEMMIIRRLQLPANPGLASAVPVPVLNVAQSDLSASRLKYVTRALPAILLGAFLSGCTAPADSPALVLEKARIQMQRDQPAEAIPLLDQAISLAPDSAEARYQRGVAMEAVGALDKALLDYNECLRITADRKDALNNKAVVLAKLKRFDEAEAVFTRLVEINPEESLGYRNRALCHVEVKKYDEALADYAKALELDPKEPANWYQRAAVYQAQQRWAEADSDFSKAIELDAELAPAYMNRGVVRYRMGDKAAAAKDLTKAQELDSAIVVPDVGFFSQASGSATESMTDNGSALWIEARTVAEQDLKNRGATEIQLVLDFPAQGCGLFRVTMDGTPQSVVVSIADETSFELPAELLQNESAGNSSAFSAMPQHLLLIHSPAGSSGNLSVAMFQPNWNAQSSNGRPSLFRFSLPSGLPK